MRIVDLRRKVLLGALVLAAGLLTAGARHGSQDGGKPRAALESIVVRGELPAPPDGVTDLKFREFFKMPIGPRGLEPSEKLMSLNGRRVRLVGYMAREDTPVAGLFHLVPLPVELDGEDEGLADDLPASTVFVHLDTQRKKVTHVPGLLNLTGVLEVGSLEEADGRVSSVRLLLDPALATAVLNPPLVAAP